MKINRLKLTQFRAFEQAEIDFNDGMNLLVGINGIGKSSVLDSLCILLSRIIPKITKSSCSYKPCKLEDITVGSKFLKAECQIQHFDILFQCELEKKANQSKSSFLIQPNPSELTKDLQEKKQKPLAIYFSTIRSLTSMSNTSNSINKVKDQEHNSAFHQALSSRKLYIQEFAQWMLAQETLAKEGLDIAEKHLNVLKNAICQFLDNCSNLRVISEPKTTLLLDKNGKTLDVRLFSDGEKRMISLVLDLAKRLSQANPRLDDPLKDGQGIVLIDELDLHLHPRWQRSIVQRLTKTFPSCQFIATTHSPQIIGEVDPKNLILLKQEDQKINIYQENLLGFGFDSNWILEHLMETDSRNPIALKKINMVEEALEEGELENARKYLQDLKSLMHNRSDGEVYRLEASINNLEVLANEIY